MSSSARKSIEVTGMVVENHVFQAYLRIHSRDSRWQEQQSVVRAKNCAIDTTIEDVYKAFEYCGPIVFVIMKFTKRDKFRKRKMFYIRFEVEDSMILAKLLEDDIQIRNRRLKMSKRKLPYGTIEALRRAMR